MIKFRYIKGKGYINWEDIPAHIQDRLFPYTEEAKKKGW